MCWLRDHFFVGKSKNHDVIQQNWTVIKHTSTVVGSYEVISVKEIKMKLSKTLTLSIFGSNGKCKGMIKK